MIETDYLGEALDGGYSSLSPVQEDPYGGFVEIYPDMATGGEASFNPANVSGSPLRMAPAASAGTVSASASVPLWALALGAWLLFS